MTFEEEKERFIKHGECKHNPDHYEEVEPYGCDVKITQCGVCGEKIGWVYLT